MLPYPWSALAKVVVVRVLNEQMVMLSDFHSQVLYPDGPMPVSMDVLRLRLSRIKSGQILCDKDNHPMVIPLLKQAQAIRGNAARTKLVSLNVMESALLAAGMRPDHVATIIHTYKTVTESEDAPAADHEEGQLPAADNQPQVPPTSPPQAEHGEALEAQRSDSGETPDMPQPDVPPAPQGHVAAQSPAAVTTPQPQIRQGVRSVPSVASAAAPTRQKRTAPIEPLEASLQRDWPLTLPELAFPPRALVDDYGLQSIIPNFRDNAEIPLGRQLTAFKSWCTTPVHIGRGTEYLRPVANITYEGCESSVLGFMGFMLKVSLVRSHVTCL